MHIRLRLEDFNSFRNQPERDINISAAKSLLVARIANLGVRNSLLPPPTFRFESFPEQFARSSLIDPQGLHEKLPQSRFPEAKNCTGGVQYIPGFFANRGSVPNSGTVARPPAPQEKRNSERTEAQRRTLSVRPYWGSSLALRSSRSILTFDLTQWFFATHMKHRCEG